MYQARSRVVIALLLWSLAARGRVLAAGVVGARAGRRRSVADGAAVAGGQPGRAPGTGSELRGDVSHPAYCLGKPPTARVRAVRRWVDRLPPQRDDRAY